MPNIALRKKTQLSSFRRIAIGTWKTAADPSVYGSLSLRMDEALRYRDAFRAATGRRLTLTHMFARAVAAALEAMPDANAVLRFNRIYLRETVGVFFQVALRDEQTGEIDLSGAVVHRANEKSLLEILDEFDAQVHRVRKQEDEQLEGTRSTFKRIPALWLNRFLDLLGLLCFKLNLDMRWAGIPNDPFGSCMVTNIGTLGLEAAYVPLVPYSHIPLLLALGAVAEEPVVVDGELGIAKIMRVYATFDHRILDGTHAAKMSSVLERWFGDPFHPEHFGPIPETAAAAAVEPASAS